MDIRKEGLTKKVGAYIAQTKFEQVPAGLMNSIKDSVIDTIGCGILGSRVEFVKMLREYVAGWKSAEESVLWGTGRKAAIPFAAMCNSAAVHAWDYDDTTLPGIMHPGGPAMATGISIAERKKVSGKEFLTALALGYEIADLMGVALGSKDFVSTGFYNSVPVIFAPAVVAGKLLGLNEAQLTSALGIATTQAAGLYSATMTKRINSPKAVMNGIIAAELAKRGLEAPKDSLEADYSGFVKTFSPSAANLEVILRDLGKFTVQVFHKYYPCIRSNHPSVENARKMMDQHPDIQAEKIEKVTTYVDKTTIEYTVNTTGGGTIVETVGNALISLPYCVAAMLVDGELTLAQFTETKVKDSKIQSLLKKVELAHDPEIDKLPATDRYRCTMEIRLKDGKVYKRFLAGPKGDPTNRFSRQDMYGKFMKNATTVFPKKKMEELFKVLEGVEEMKDVRKIASYLST